MNANDNTQTSSGWYFSQNVGSGDLLAGLHLHRPDGHVVKTIQAHKGKIQIDVLNPEKWPARIGDNVLPDDILDLLQQFLADQPGDILSSTLARRLRLAA